MTEQERKHVERSWGTEDWIVNNDLYCGKKMFLLKDYKCSFHWHKVKAESFFVEKGQMLLRYGYDDDITKAVEIVLNPGDSFDIPVTMRHQFQGIDDTEFFEFSTHHDDADVVRVSLGGKCNL